MEDPKPEFERIQDFVAAYANNVQLQPSAWDIKLVFGELNQSVDNVTVEQHTSITIAWPEAKVLSYWLQIHVAAYEIENGKIQVPKGVVPPEPDPLTDEQRDNESAKAFREMLLKIRARFLDSL